MLCWFRACLSFLFSIFLIFCHNKPKTFLSLNQPGVSPLSLSACLLTPFYSLFPMFPSPLYTSLSALHWYKLCPNFITFCTLPRRPTILHTHFKLTPKFCLNLKLLKERDIYSHQNANFRQRDYFCFNARFICVQRDSYKTCNVIESTSEFYLDRYMLKCNLVINITSLTFFQQYWCPCESPRAFAQDLIAITVLIKLEK